jgi:hypothetical protein
MLINAGALSSPTPTNTGCGYCVIATVRQYTLLWAAVDSRLDSQTGFTGILIEQMNRDSVCPQDIRSVEKALELLVLHMNNTACQYCASCG